ncbi:LOW QUALITY PROTEIN: ycf68 protein [Cinnamomum micranthum f. kanehirae]|uniref:Ycf68 protein n=1 Tax=Cinnamomum micranthum f. kanehirae TaxID=337451 RepID=A0A3S3P0Q8_9MAGN|nr:LOW QUALITY PROTEIN: ycf68 protein [Cinnamomum micranthum f. kanehirae]
MAVVSSCRKTAGDKPEEGEDDVKSSCPLCPGRHTCYNGRDKGSRSRQGELTPKKTRPKFGLQAATRLHEAGIASNRRHTAVNSFPGLVHTARHTVGAGYARSRYLNRKEGDAEGGASDWSEVVTR